MNRIHRFFYTCFPYKLFDELIGPSPKTFIFLKTFDLEFSCIEVWFSDQKSKLLEIEDKLKINLVFNQVVKYKKFICYAVQYRDRIFVKSYGFFFFFFLLNV